MVVESYTHLNALRGVVAATVKLTRILEIVFVQDVAVTAAAVVATVVNKPAIRVVVSHTVRVVSVTDNVAHAWLAGNTERTGVVATSCVLVCTEHNGHKHYGNAERKTADQSAKRWDTGRLRWVNTRFITTS